MARGAIERSIHGAGRGKPVRATRLRHMSCSVERRQVSRAGRRFRHPVKLRDGRTVVADDAYIRNAIANPGSDLMAGYAPSMPSFQGQINEEQLLDLIAYIKSLGGEESQANAQ